MPNGPPPAGPVALPGWLGPIVSITTQVGVPTVFAGVLLYFVLFRLDTAMKIIERGEETRTQIIAAMQDSLVAALDHQTHVFEESVKENIRANQRIAEEAKRDRDLFLQRFPGGPK